MIDALLSIIVPLLPFFIPGIGLIPRLQKRAFVDGSIVVVLTSLLTYLLGSFLLAILGLPVITIIPISFGVLLILLVLERSEWKIYFSTYLWQFLSVCVPFLLIFAAFTIPFLIRQDGLPTGDIQKSIYWGQFTAERNTLPPYSLAPEHLNRDPVDFYTPALHTLSAVILDASPAPHLSMGLLAIAAAVMAAGMAGALTYHALPKHTYWAYTATLAIFFVLTNVRFLRYLREPGYHFQNSLGELLLFSLVALGLSLLDSKEKVSTILLIIVTAITLLFTHQFSAFIAAFTLIPVVLALLFRHREGIRQYIYHHFILVALAVIGMATLALSLHLQTKIPQLFTTTPHLSGLVPPLHTYPLTLGIIWFLAGLTGFFIVIFQKNIRTQLSSIAFLGIVLVLFVLSQGPRVFIDIPPVRALFYLVIPFSVLSAYFFVQAWRMLSTAFIPSKIILWPARLLLLGILIIPTMLGTLNAYSSSSPSVRTNSTLQSDQLYLSEYIREHSEPTDAVLIDDYNQRSASWLILSGQPMFTRIAADLEIQMNEAIQSPLREKLYLAQLDFEKVFSLGSQREIVDALARWNIRYVTGIAGSSDSAFKYNPALRPVAYGKNITLYEVVSDPLGCSADTLCHWLLRPSTLVNDIGDQMDTFEHVPASLRAPRLSEPLNIGATTYRVTSAPYIPLRFNIGDFVKYLWDKDMNNEPDSTVELYVKYEGEQISVVTPTGKTYNLPSDTPIRIPAEESLIDERGFLTFTMHNPSEKPLQIDIIAVGLSRVP